MPRSLKKLKKVIFGEDMTDEEWLKIHEEVNEALKSATEKEKQDFWDSGAGDMLEQIIEFMD
nr:MAG TPA: hypothetical protein [Bacteriophage sp.]